MHSGTTYDRTALANAMSDADLRVLLMSLVHQTGDLRWLEPPYTPKRDVSLIADPSAGLPDSVQAELRAQAIEVFAQSRSGPVLTDLDDALMIRMMRTCLGEKVPPEYAPAMRDELGFTDRDVHWSKPTDQNELAGRDVLIVGAGVNGIVLGAKLGQLGIPYTIVEKNKNVGGTWLENSYPGCGVDTPNHAYSLSFGRRYRWSRYFSLRDEIQDYLERCTHEFGVQSHIRFQTTLTSSRWIESDQCWESELEGPDGKEFVRSGFLVSAIGQFNQPRNPTIPGSGSFEGEAFHTAHWPAGIDLTNQRVSIIGTGASAMQIVPSIADQVESLTIYQRTPQWVRPIPSYGKSIPSGAQWLLEHLPYYVEWFRFTMFWRYGDGLLPFLRKDPNWPYPDRALNRVNDRHRQEMVDHMANQLKDHRDIAARCLPDYPAYGKRILLDNGWYQALTLPQVHLISDPIDQITESGVSTNDGTHRTADILIYAIGFEMMQMAARLNIKGRDGVDLIETWDGDNPTAYLGITVPGYPNFFCLLGPNTGLGHGGSAMFQAECQTRYITACIVEMIENNLASLEIHREAHDTYVEQVDTEHQQMIWSHPGMTTYYRNARGRVVTVMPWRLVDYWKMTHEADLDNYHVTPLNSH